MNLPRSAIVAGALCALGLTFVGGWAIGKRRGGSSATLTLLDSGVNIGLTNTTSSACGPCQCDAGFEVRILPGRPPPPIVIYLPADAGRLELPGCPTCPTVDVVGGASATGGAAVATASADAGVGVSVMAVASAAAPGPPRGPEWDALAGLGYGLDGNLVVPVGVAWHPGGGRLGVGVLVQAKPAAMSQTSGSVVLELGF